jgi:LysR family transcriptional regulator, nitrogen assimilation regulatory protein
VNLRRLKYFLKIVDVGSVTQASELLHIAQPALSQQIATLEGEFRQQLLLRTGKGVTPTEAGKVLYRHAQLILRQFEQAQAEVRNAGQTLTGKVSVGLAPGTAASELALPLLKAVRARHPDVLLHLNENFGTTLGDLILNGRMDMAVLYGSQAAVGLSFFPLLHEALVLVAPRTMEITGTEVDLAVVRDLDLLLLRPHNAVRKRIDEALMRAQITPNVVAEIESTSNLIAAVANGLGATILPLSAARLVASSGDARLCPIVNPTIEVPLSLCTSDNLPLSQPALAVKGILMELAADLALNIGATQSLELEEALPAL